MNADNEEINTMMVINLFSNELNYPIIFGLDGLGIFIEVGLGEINPSNS